MIKLNDIAMLRSTVMATTPVTNMIMFVAKKHLTPEMRENLTYWNQSIEEVPTKPEQLMMRYKRDEYLVIYFDITDEEILQSELHSYCELTGWIDELAKLMPNRLIDGLGNGIPFLYGSKYVNSVTGEIRSTLPEMN